MYPDHPNMKTIAIMCNEVTECYDGSDEACKDSTLSKLLLSAAALGVLLLYLGLKLSRDVFRKYWHQPKSPAFLKFNHEDIFQKLSTTHDDHEAITALNNLLLHTINSKKIQETK